VSDASRPDLEIVGQAVLRDYPLRLWARQQQHTDEVLREFNLLIGGQELADSSAPVRLVQLAQMFSDSFGSMIDELTAARQAQYDAGADRMDWRVPLPRSTPTLMRQVQAVWTAVDDYCAAGQLLTLARPAEVIALQEWSSVELIRQAEGAQPTPWPGPF
jgi:hypothetical protein